MAITLLLVDQIETFLNFELGLDNYSYAFRFIMNFLFQIIKLKTQLSVPTPILHMTLNPLQDEIQYKTRILGTTSFMSHAGGNVKCYFKGHIFIPFIYFYTITHIN